MFNKVMECKLVYLATYHPKNEPGVHKKVQGVIEAAIRLGYTAENLQEGSDEPLKRWRIIVLLLRCNARIVIIRSMGVTNLLLLPFLLIAKLQGKQLILDMPTPRKAAYFEVIRNRGRKKMITYTILHFLNGPWTMWPYDRIIQYGGEHAYFLWGNKKRTFFTGNGIQTSRMPLREKNYQWPDEYLRLVGVGNISYYHGFDRVVKAIYHWNSIPGKRYRVIFTIIGNGQYIETLKELVAELQLIDFVKFEGQRDSDFIHQVYSCSHLAVSSLGLYRINLSQSGVLKTREYCLSGIPFIASGYDFDFPKELPFRIVVANNETINDILQMFENIDAILEKIEDADIRAYAVNNLSFEAKLVEMGIGPIN